MVTATNEINHSEAENQPFLFGKKYRLILLTLFFLLTSCKNAQERPITEFEIDTCVLYRPLREEYPICYLEVEDNETINLLQSLDQTIQSSDMPIELKQLFQQNIEAAVMMVKGGYLGLRYYNSQEHFNGSTIVLTPEFAQEIGWKPYIIIISQGNDPRAQISVLHELLHAVSTILNLSNFTDYGHVPNSDAFASLFKEKYQHLALPQDLLAQEAAVVFTQTAFQVNVLKITQTAPEEAHPINIDLVKVYMALEQKGITNPTSKLWQTTYNLYFMIQQYNYVNNWEDLKAEYPNDQNLKQKVLEQQNQHYYEIGKLTNALAQSPLSEEEINEFIALYEAGCLTLEELNYIYIFLPEDLQEIVDGLRVLESSGLSINDLNYL